MQVGVLAGDLGFIWSTDMLLVGYMEPERILSLNIFKIGRCICYLGFCFLSDSHKYLSSHLLNN